MVKAKEKREKKRATSGTASLFGIELITGTKEELLARVTDLLGKGGSVATVNAEIAYDSLKDEGLRRALGESLCIPESIGVELALAVRGIRSATFPGVELGEAILDVVPLGLAVIGGKPGVARLALARLCEKHKLVTPIFALDGYNYTEREVEELLRKYTPDVVFVCLGSPKQELFISNVRKYSEKSLFLALGGSADVYSGMKSRAPRVFRAFRLEWAYRMIREPKRLKRLPKLLRFACKSIAFRDKKVENI
ncbi:MAG: WecB/TagA/CpsF family glycosyltransferase [Ruminococcaceae bacterium]|nr:WecB/TagA/CpsF family glycosyltransferase [Oscillospiraceae bacterium]